MRTLRCIAAIAAFALISGCNGNQGSDVSGPEPFRYDAPWPGNVQSFLTVSFTDASGDLEALPVDMDGPPYSGPVAYPAVDVTQISLGMNGNFLYMRVDYEGTIPDDVVHLQRDGEVEEQWVRNQGMNIALNVDGDVRTGGGGEGVSGIEIFFAVGFEYGGEIRIYANYDFPDGDLHHAMGQEIAELGEGGPGHDYAVVRYDVSGLGQFFPRGATVDIGSWSEAESYNADGTLKYHHFAFDRVIDGQQWTLP